MAKLDVFQEPVLIPRKTYVLYLSEEEVQIVRAGIWATTVADAIDNEEGHKALEALILAFRSIPRPKYINDYMHRAGGELKLR